MGGYELGTAMIDWQRVALDIQHAGYPLTRAARLVRCDPQHIGRLARGEVNEPRFGTGVRLLDLHLDLCPERHAEVMR